MSRALDIDTEHDSRGYEYSNRHTHFFVRLLYAELGFSYRFNPLGSLPNASHCHRYFYVYFFLSFPLFNPPKVLRFEELGPLHVPGHGLDLISIRASDRLLPNGNAKPKVLGEDLRPTKTILMYACGWVHAQNWHANERLRLST